MSGNRGLIEHVTDVHNADPHDYFDEPAHDASSTFWVRQDGHVEQYVEVGVRAWAQAAGNDDYDSVETAGMHDEALTDAQVEALAHLYAWGHVHRGWKLQLAEKPGEYGFGWHGMGGEAWGGHFGCPGDERKAQREAVLARAKDLLDAGHRPPAPQPAPAHHVNAGTDGAHPGKSAEVADLQKAVHAKADGFWGHDTDHALFVLRAVAQHGVYNTREAQRVVGVDDDGAWGPKSRAAAHAAVDSVQHALGVNADGAWGPRTESAFNNARAKYRIA